MPTKTPTPGKHGHRAPKAASPVVPQPSTPSSPTPPAPAPRCAPKGRPETENRACILGSIAVLFEAMNEYQLGQVYDFAQVVEMNIGNGPTPIEHFIVNLPWLHIEMLGRGEGLTPDAIIEELTPARGFFDDALKAARHFNEGYRHVRGYSTPGNAA